MNKKQLATAVAVCLASMAGYASAASVEVYARMDLGLNYLDTLKTPGYDGEQMRGLSLASGQNTTSRFGLKGKEKLDNGWVVGFKAEANVDADTGAGTKKDRLFYREAIVYIQGDFGEIGMGRCGLIDSGNGTYGLLEDDFVAFGTGWGETLGTNEYIMMGLHKRTDNVITYKSPKIAGTNYFVQASTQMDSVDDKGKGYADEIEGTSDATRYYAVGAKYAGGPFKAFMTISRDDYGYTDMKKGGDDALTVSAGVMYDFDVVNLKFAAQYFDQGANKKAKGMGYAVSATAPVLGGKLYGYLGYTDAEQTDDASKQITNYMASVGYEYKLSKKTHLYAGVSYLSQDDDREDEKCETFEAMSGLVIKF